MLFIKNRRKLIEYMINEGRIDQNRITGKGIMKKYREMREEVFCPGVFRDDCYEKFWLIGYEVGYKQALLGDDVEIPAISAPANALSRMCGEIALLYKEGYLKKIGRGFYVAETVPVSFQPKKKREEEEVDKVAETAEEFVQDAKEVVEEVVDEAKRLASKTAFFVKIATEAALKAVQEELKK